MRLRRGKDEFDVGGRFLQGFQESVEGLLGEHVNFVDVHDAEGASGRGETYIVAQIANMVDASVGCTVDFQNIQTAPFGNFLANILGWVEVRAWSARAV